MAADPINYRSLQFDAQGRPFYRTQSGQVTYPTPLNAAEAAAMFVTDPAQRATLLQSRGTTPEQAARLEAFARGHGVTQENPSGVGTTNGFLRRTAWDARTGQYASHMGAGVSGLIQGGAALAGPMFVGPLLAGSPTILGGSGAAAGAGSGSGVGSTVAPGVVNLATPASTAAIAPVAPGAAVAGGGAAATGGATAETVRRSLGDVMRDPRTYAGGLAALLPALQRGGGGSPFDTAAINDELAKSLAMQRGRMEQAQPVYDTLVNMAYGMSPTRYRGAAPAGYTANTGPEGPYKATLPKFGGG